MIGHHSRRRSSSSIVLSAVVLLGLLLPGSPEGTRASDPILNCGGCPIPIGDLDRLVSWFTCQDLLFEGEFLGSEEISEDHYERGRQLLFFKVREVLLGVAQDSIVNLSRLARLDYNEEAFGPGSRVVVRVSRKCMASGFNCGNFLQILDDGRLRRDWISGRALRRLMNDPTELTYERFREALAIAKADNALEKLEKADAIALVSLLRTDEWSEENPVWKCDSLGWVLNTAPRVPSFVRLVWTRASTRGPSPENQFLLPLSSTAKGDTVIIDYCANQLVVRNGFALGLGVDVDELESVFVSSPEGRRIRTHLWKKK